MPTSKDTDDELRELRLYRELRGRRDPTIRRLRRKSVNVGRIAAASGLSVSQVERIGRTKAPPE